MADTTQVELEQELLRIQMDDSREALAQKIEMLEEKVTDTVQSATASVAEATANVMETVQNATASVTDTVDSVTTAVQGTVDSVRQSVEGTVDSVKDAFDVNRQFNQHPWLMFAGAIAVGYVGGTLLQSSAAQRVARPNRAKRDEGFRPSVRSDVVEQPLYAAPETSTNGFHANSSTVDAASRTKAPGWLNMIAETFGPEIGKLQNLAIGAAIGSARDLLSETVPVALRQPLAEIMDGFTEKLGGKCIHGSLVSMEPDISNLQRAQPNSIHDYR